MREQAIRTPERQPRGPGRREFVALMAALMASNALAIDAMLPALPAMAEALGVGAGNQQQLVITSYLIGFGAGQILLGPLADRFGRRWLLIGSLVLYAVFAALSGIAGSFTLLLAARALQGVAASGSRVLVMAIVRDRFHGSAMAQVMSLIMVVFMIVPVLAPSFGQVVLSFAGWRHIFIGLAVYGVVLTIWSWMRIEETLDPANRRSLAVASIAGASWEALGNRAFLGNTLASTLLMGALFAFINSIQQIVDVVFGRAELLALVFPLIAGPMALSSYANSRLVMRFGSRRLLLNALALFTLASLAHLVFASVFVETLWTFVAFTSAAMICFGLIGANAGALAMEPVGHIAGMASSVQGVLSTIGGALIGLAIGQAFDGTTVPLAAGFTLCGAAALAIAMWANPLALSSSSPAPRRSG